MKRFLLIALVAACGGKESATPSTGSAVASGSAAGSNAEGSVDDTACEKLPFAESSPVPEASGAAWMTIDGKLVLVVISDSGNDGAYAILDPETGVTGEQGKLPLGTKAGADIEGLATRDGTLFGVTSSGWLRAWDRKGGAFELFGDALPLGPVDLPDKSNNDKPPDGTGMVCGPKATNCGRNYEGLCLAPDVKAGCLGFVASKADGDLYCLENVAPDKEGGELRARFTKRIAIARPGTVADCAFSADGALYVGTNLFDASTVYRVDGWSDPATAKVVKIASIGSGFPEAMAVRGDVIYRFSDTGGAPSLLSKFRCKR